MAAQAGLERRLSGLEHQTKAVYGQPAAGELWDIDLEAAAAELAVAKGLGKFWSPAESAALDREQGDVGAGWQVRWTRRENGRLIVHPRDADGHIFLLVVGSMPDFRICGWIRGVDAKREEFMWAGAPRPAYFVPQSALTAIE